MPGTPLSKFKKGLAIEFGPGCLSSKRPNLAKYVMFHIEQWAQTELQFLMVLRYCLGGDPTLAAEMLLAIENQSVQRTVIMTATKSVLAKEDWPIMEAAFMSMNASRNIRNRFAHHLWGIAEDMPDAALLLDPKDMAVLLAQELKKLAIAKKAGKATEPLSLDDILDRTKVMVWREADFRSACDESVRAGKLMGLIKEFIFRTRNGTSVDSIRQSLLSDQLIQQRLQKVSQQRTPEVR